jgi:N-acetylneuraminate synthase
MSTAAEADDRRQPPPSSTLRIGTRRIGGGAPPLIIAEAGSAHGGDLARARSLIAYARDAGADCIKFQAIIADEIVHPAAGSITLPGGDIPIWSRFRELERPPDFYAELKEETERAGLLFLCSAFGLGSADLLLSLGVSAIKIASPELNHYPLLERAAAVPLLMSAGVSLLGDIEESCSFLRERGGEAALLHCITAYPAPEEEYNLRIIPLLQQLFGVPAGVSDHSRDPLLVPLLAASEGAAVIEKHLTFPERGDGLDDPIALTPGSFERMCRELRERKNCSAEEIRSRLVHGYSEETVAAVLGNGRKTLSPSEEPFYRTSNRSVVALRDLPPGTRVSKENCALLRTEQNRPAGLRPSHWPQIDGCRLVRAVRAGEGISWSHLLRSD